MPRKNILMLLIVLLQLFLIIGCDSSEDDDDDGDSRISLHNTSISHRAGQACLNCHSVGSSNEYQFRTAGTVYNLTETAVYPNTTIYLYTSANAAGNLVATIEVDALGNFYTTQNIDWGNNGLYPVVESSQGMRFMLSPTSDGNCNGCHTGNSLSRIYVD
ncbi:hypothetical protein [Kaarinaea lacus]